MLSQIAFGIGAICLGSAITVALFLILAGRHRPTNRTEGCYTTFICLSIFFVGVGFFVVGLLSATI